jgi:hypothetical protein
MQPSQQTTANNLQGSSSTLQQQDTTTQYQQTSGVGQDALGPDQYKSFDKLSVKGAQPTGVSAGVATGNITPEVVILVCIIVIFVCVLLYKKYVFNKRDDILAIEGIAQVNLQTADLKDTQMPTTPKTKKNKSNKKATSKVKKPTKKAKKPSKR